MDNSVWVMLWPHHLPNDAKAGEEWQRARSVVKSEKSGGDGGR